MARPAVLSVKVITDASQSNKELDKSATGIQKWEGKLKKARIPAIAALGAIVALGKGSIDSASKLQQAAGAVQQVFGKSAPQINKLAKNAANAVGLSKSEYLNMAAVIGSQLKNMGVPIKDVANQTDWLVKKGADLAAMFGGTTSDAVEALSALLRGERDPIERYGVSINQAQINAYEAAAGTNKLTGAEKKHADLQATLAILTKQTAQATGQFARETTTAAGAAEIQAAKFENAKAALGTALLPVVAKASGIMAAFFGVLSRNVGVTQALIGVIAGLAISVLSVSAAVKVIATGKTIATGISKVAQGMGRLADGYRDAGAASSAFSGKLGTVGGALRSAATATMTGVQAATAWVAAQVKAGAAAAATAVKTVALKVAELASAAATATWTAIQTAFNAVMALNPVILITAGIIALIAAIILAYKRVGWFRDLVNAVFRALGTAVRAVASVVTGVFRAAWSVAGAYVRTWLSITRTALNAARTVINAVVSAVRAVANVVVGPASAAFRTWYAIARAQVAAIRTVIGAISNTIRSVVSVVGRIGGAFRSAAGAARSAIQPILGVVNQVAGAIQNLVNVAGSVGKKVGGVLGKLNPTHWFAASQAVPDYADLKPGWTLLAAHGPARAAPVATGYSSGNGSNVTLKITFSGLVTDKDGVAREIENLLRKRGVRLGKVS